MKVAHLRVDEGALREALHLPDDVEIIAIHPDPSLSGSWQLRLVGGRFAEVRPGFAIPPARHMLTRTRHECGHETIEGDLQP